MTYSALAKERILRGLSQQDVAKRMGYSYPSTVSRFEAGLLLHAPAALVAAYAAATGIPARRVARLLQGMGVTVLRKKVVDTEKMRA